MIQVPPAQPNYNAVKIDIHNPQVNVPTQAQATVPMATAQQPVQQTVQSMQTPQVAPTQVAPAMATPIYSSVPTASVYEVPTQSIYEPKTGNNPPQSAQPEPIVPVPVIVPPTVVQTPVAPQAPVSPAPTPATVAQTAPASTEAIVAPVPVETKEADKTASAQKVEVVTPEVVAPKLDVNAFIGRLTNPDFEQQASAMEEIAELAQTSPKQATELLDVKVVDTLLGIMSADSSKLQGPSPKQLQIREKMINGKPVTDAEKVEAVKITPMEQAERNKQYAIYTVAILQKLYGSEIEKMNNTVVPMTELPGAAGIVQQVKTNPNPMVRAAGIDALSYIQRSEYKQDLTTLFTVAKKDKDSNVQKAAAKALEKLTQVADMPKALNAQTTPAATQEPKKVA